MTAQDASPRRSPAWPRWVLRASLTLAALLLISQSITAGLFMGDVGGAFPLHRELATAAGIALMVGFVAAILCVRLCGEARWLIWATAGMLVLMSLQAFAGYRSLTALHVPLGVVTIVAGLALAAWSWIPRPGPIHGPTSATGAQRTSVDDFAALVGAEGSQPFSPRLERLGSLSRPLGDFADDPERGTAAV